MKFRPRAEAICFRNDTVLADWTMPYVCFPGGGVDPGESAVDAVIRETWEEAGRRLLHPQVLHPPVENAWKTRPKGAWAEGYDGSRTYWFTGTTQIDPVRGVKHQDFQPHFSWKPIAQILERLRHDKDGSWAAEVRARIAILEAHQAGRRRLA